MSKVKIKIKSGIVLAPFTTFGIGGKAKFFVEVGSVDELAKAIKFKRDNRLSHFVLGGGSNILVPDEGFDGLVIKMDIYGLWINDRVPQEWAMPHSEKLRSRLSTGVILRAGADPVPEKAESFGSSKLLLRCGAGEVWDDVVKVSVERGLVGIEYLSGIPGTVGGAVVQNVGAYGQTLSDTVESVNVFDIKTEELKKMSVLECGFEYRESIFKHNPRYIVVSVDLKLVSSKRSVSGYHDIINYFKGKPDPSPREAREAVLEIRRKKGMLIKANGMSFQTAGSFFKNPVVEETTFQKIAVVISEDRERPWFWRQQDGGIKLAAAKLLEEVGFKKGYCSGKVGISPKHSLSFINLGDANALDIIKLAEMVKTAVYDKFSVKLESEVKQI